MDSIVVIIVVVWIVAHVINMLHKNKYPETKLGKEELCPPHLWKYTDLNKLYCDKCSFVAGLKEESEK